MRKLAAAARSPRATACTYERTTQTAPSSELAAGAGVTGAGATGAAVAECDEAPNGRAVAGFDVTAATVVAATAGVADGDTRGEADGEGRGVGDGRDVGEGRCAGVGLSVGIADGTAAPYADSGEGATATREGSGRGVFPPKKCARTPPSSRPARITTTINGKSGNPRPGGSSSMRRRRGGSLMTPSGSYGSGAAARQTLRQRIAECRRQRGYELGPFRDEQHRGFLQ